MDSIVFVQNLKVANSLAVDFNNRRDCICELGCKIRALATFIPAPYFLDVPVENCSMQVKQGCSITVSCGAYRHIAYQSLITHALQCCAISA